MATTRPKHKPNEKHTLDEVLKSLQDLVRNKVLEKPVPSPTPRTPSGPAPAAAKEDVRSIISSLEDLLSNDLSPEERKPARAVTPPTPKAAAPVAPAPVAKTPPPVQTPKTPPPKLEAFSDDEFELPTFEDASTEETGHLEPKAAEAWSTDAFDEPVVEADISADAAPAPIKAIEYDAINFVDEPVPAEATASTPSASHDAPPEVNAVAPLELALKQPKASTTAGKLQQQELALTLDDDQPDNEPALPAIEVEETTWDPEAEAAFAASLTAELQTTAEEISAAPAPADDGRQSNSLSVDFVPGAGSIADEATEISEALTTEASPTPNAGGLSVEYTPTKKITSKEVDTEVNEEVLEESLTLTSPAPPSQKANAPEELEDLTPPLPEEVVISAEARPGNIESPAEPFGSMSAIDNDAQLGDGAELLDLSAPEAEMGTSASSLTFEDEVIEAAPAPAPAAVSQPPDAEEIVAAPAPAPKPTATTTKPQPAPTPKPAAPTPATRVADDIPVLEDVHLAAPPAPKLAPPVPAPANVRDMAIKVIAKLNIELRKSGEQTLSPKLVNRLQQLLGETLKQKETK